MRHTRGFQTPPHNGADDGDGGGGRVCATKTVELLYSGISGHKSNENPPRAEKVIKRKTY